MLSPHDPIWASEFEELRTIFAQALGHLTLRIEHVGSTAIPDLFAKPILDIDIVIQDYSAFPQIVSALESLGYEHRGDQGIFEREVFKPKIATPPLAVPPKAWMPHHLYVCPASGRELRRHICFRDTLLGRSDLRREYQAMKMSIAGRAMGEHLVSAGYRRIAYLAARLDPRSNRRMAGFRAVSAMTWTEARNLTARGGRTLDGRASRRPERDERTPVRDL